MATIASTPSSTQSATVSTSDWWLKDVSDPSLNQTIAPDKATLTVEEPEDATVFKPLGRPNAVVVSDVIRGVEFTLTVITTAKSEREAIQRLRETQRTLFLQTNYGEQWYVRLQGRRRKRRTIAHPDAPDHHEFTMEAVEVDVPD